ncbi:MAG TPA: hypothetical protein VE842_06900 [Pyrinomonadaceae bacterium]|nr:hypothetical protein [Pyrinomonadaceae bacterium]
MFSSRLFRQGTGLLLSLAILLNCSAQAIYSATLSSPTIINRASHLPGGRGARTAGLRSRDQSFGNLAGMGTIFAALMPTGEADMVIYASAHPSAIESGGAVNFNSTVYNYGPDEATDATLTTTLPADVEVNTAETPAGSCTITPVTNGTTVTCPLGDMNVYEAQTATINATINVDNGLDLLVGITAESTLTDPVAENNTANVLLLVRESAQGPGGKLAFVTYRDGDAEIYVTNADGSGVVNLTDDPAYDWEPAWSPDGTQLVFNSDRSGAEELWLMDSDGSNPTRLTTNGSNGVNFVWSPDGTKIAWQNWDSNTGNYDICVINADGTGFSNLTNDSDSQDKPQWSPNGTKILYQGDVTDPITESCLPDVFVMNSDGSGKTNLTNTPEAGDFAPVWSPDGTKIAFGRSYDDQGIYVMDSDGTDQSPVFTDSYNGGVKAEWSPDGTGLAFDTYVDGDSEIYCVNLDGSGLTNITSDGDYDFEAKWQPVAQTPP